MKRLEQLIFATILCLFHSGNAVFAAFEDAENVRISLLTCSEGDKSYTMFGHTALRCQDLRQGADITVNYGMFSFHKPYFFLRFLFGITDYEMGIIPTPFFIEEYRSEGREVTEQEMNLSLKDKEAIMQAITENAKPENIEYRYNYFYDNCTLRARNIVLKNLKGAKIEQKEANTGVEIYSPKTYRQCVHLCNEKYPWTRFGTDLLLGVKADMPVTRDEMQFLPRMLKESVAEDKITRNGKSESLALTNDVLVKGQDELLSKPCAFTPILAAVLFAVLVLAISFWELKSSKTFFVLDLLVFLAMGIAGLLLFALIFSSHPTTTLNLNVLVLNPLLLVFLYHVVQCERKVKETKFFKYACIFIATYLLGAFVQRIPLEMIILSLALLLRMAVLGNVFGLKSKIAAIVANNKMTEEQR